MDNGAQILPFGYPRTRNSLTWAHALRISDEFQKPYFQELEQIIAMERQSYIVYPPPHQVYTWTEMCCIQDVKVVILGQDPYHGAGQAHGLCFSVQTGMPLPPSLENIYKELATDIEGFKHPGHGNLTGWATQGVLLLNAILTVRDGEARSHRNKGWEHFTDAVISWLNNNQSGLVFMLWGEYAKQKDHLINKMRHRVFMTSHPSPCSVGKGFKSCRHFSSANRYLEENGKTPINWTNL